MLTLDQNKEFLDIYINGNNEIAKYIFQELENFKQKEEFLKTYAEALTYLEKIQNKVNLQMFESLIQSIYNELSKFDPDNMEYNLYQIQQMILNLEESEQELSEVTKEIESIKRLWQGFLNRYPEVKESELEKNFNLQIDILMQNLANTNINQVGMIEDSLTNLKRNVEQIILLYEQLKEYEKYHLFIGSDFQEFLIELKNISNLVETPKDNNNLSNEDLLAYTNKSVDNFIDMVKDFINKIEDMKKEDSVKGVIKIPVIKARHKTNKNLYKFTLKFDNYILKYEPFFYNEKALTFEDTGKYIYIENYPIRGIFKAKNAIENLKIYHNYLQAGIEYDKSIMNSFLFLMGSDLMLGLYTSFINTGFALPFLAITFGVTGLLVGLKNFLYKQKEIKYGVKRFFPFIQSDFILFKVGEDFDVQQMIIEIIKDIDNTILNQNFQRKIDKYILYQDSYESPTIKTPKFKKQAKKKINNKNNKDNKNKNELSKNINNKIRNILDIKNKISLKKIKDKLKGGNKK